MRRWIMGLAVPLLTAFAVVSLRPDLPNAHGQATSPTTAAPLSAEDRQMYDRLPAMLRSDDRAVRMEAAKFLQRRLYQPWQGTDAQVRQLSLEGLDREVLEVVAWTLSDQGPEGRKILAGQTNSADPRVRLWAKAGLAP